MLHVPQPARSTSPLQSDDRYIGGMRWLGGYYHLLTRRYLCIAWTFSLKELFAVIININRHWI